MEMKMINAIEELKGAVETQGEEIRAMKASKDYSWSEAVKLRAMKPNSDPAPPTQPAWTEVIRKKNTAMERTKKLTNMPYLRRRPPAVIIDTSREDFPALAKKIRNDIKSEVIGDHVVGMRQTKSGGLLFELRGDQEQLDLVRAEISRSAGPGITLRELRQEKLLEIRDLDEWSTKKDVEEAIARESQATSGVRVLSIRKKYGGQQIALVSAPIEALEPILKTGRLRVGMISCRARLTEQKARCFKCLCLGHIAKVCQGPDRSSCCWRCGQLGHRAAGCTATAEQAAVFSKEIASEVTPRSRRGTITEEVILPDG
jgi:hypothetical protein